MFTFDPERGNILPAEPVKEPGEENYWVKFQDLEKKLGPDFERLMPVLGIDLESLAKEHKYSDAARKEIDLIEGQKKAVIDNLFQQVENLDSAPREHGAREVTMETVDGEPRFVCWGASGRKEKRTKEVSTRLAQDQARWITPGEIITDQEWGINYYLDPQSVPADFRRTYLVEKAGYQLAALTEKQLLAGESTSPKDEIKRRTYERIKQDTGREERGGVLAEKMIKNHLKKLAFDYNLPLEIIDTNIIQDVEWKVDFIIRHQQKERGVGVEEGEAFGIQFTINNAEDIQKHKEWQITRARKKIAGKDAVLKDIILITIPAVNASEIYQKWEASRNPGGPDKIWPVNFKEDVFNQILEKFLSEEELAEMRTKAAASFKQ